MEEEKKLEEQKKPTYEELKYYCDLLLMQRNKVVERLNQVTNVLNKLPYLFKVVENKESFDVSFVHSCIKEIETIMIPPEEPENVTNKEEKE